LGREGGYHCPRQAGAAHGGGPMAEAGPASKAHRAPRGTAGAEPAAGARRPAEHIHHPPTAGDAGPGPAPEAALRSPHEVMGHGGHAGMSMEAMVRDMRARFLVAAILSVPILLWSRIGRDVLGFAVPAPLGLSDEWLQLLLSLPVVFYS